MDPIDIIHMRPMQQLLSKAEPGILFATMLAPRISYSVKADAAQVAGSIPTAYRRLHLLESIGLATIHRGQFKINRAVLQPPHVLEKLVPSLLALKHGDKLNIKGKFSIDDILKVQDDMRTLKVE